MEPPAPAQEMTAAAFCIISVLFFPVIFRLFFGFSGGSQSFFKNDICLNDFVAFKFDLFCLLFLNFRYLFGFLFMIIAGLFVSAAAAPAAAFARRTFLNGRQFFRLFFRGLFRFFRFRRCSSVRFNADNTFYPVIRRE